MQIRVPARPFKYNIMIGRGLLSVAGKEIRACLGSKVQSLALISNKKVFQLYGALVVESLTANGFQVATWLMGEGERYKSLPTAEKALNFLTGRRIQRTDAVVSLGGGVTGDLAGFAAAIYLRGISFVQMPTTLLAQIDAAIGGKVGVNLPSGKNRAGAFYQPKLVIADVETLRTLSARDLTAGWCECIKQGAIGSRKLFKRTADYLAETRSKKISVTRQLEDLIATQAAFKASIVTADVQEDPARSDSRSRRILNFGHTVGHALEELTSYRRFRHGEAVGWGMLVAGELSKNLGLLNESELESLQAAIRLCGPLPLAENIDIDAILNAVTRDKKSAGGQVQWVLLERIGRPRILSGKEIDVTSLKTSIRHALKKRNYK